MVRTKASSSKYIISWKAWLRLSFVPGDYTTTRVSWSGLYQRVSSANFSSSGCSSNSCSLVIILSALVDRDCTSIYIILFHLYRYYANISFKMRGYRFNVLPSLQSQISHSLFWVVAGKRIQKPLLSLLVSFLERIVYLNANAILAHPYHIAFR